MEAERVAANGYGTFRHGACILRGPRILRSSPNKCRPLSWVRSPLDRFHPRGWTPETYPYAERLQRARHCGHAELLAVNGLGEAVRGAIVVVVRITPDSRRAFSRPCAMCSAELARLGVRRVIYTASADTLEILAL
jgi:tRNA(Arg) A34 adenosine deaminase TadA